MKNDHDWEIVLITSAIMAVVLLIAYETGNETFMLGSFCAAMLILTTGITWLTVNHYRFLKDFLMDVLECTLPILAIAGVVLGVVGIMILLLKILGVV